MTAVLNKFKMLSSAKKVQLIVALLLTIALFIAIPVYAWFNNERKIAQLAKIKAPDELYINAAHKEDIVFLDMSSIDVSRKVPNTEDPITSQSFVFSVSGEWVNSYTLQIEHTTNNPYTYTYHKGEIYGSITDLAKAHPTYNTRNSDGSYNYVEYTANSKYDDTETSKIDNWPNYPTTGDVTPDSEGKFYIWIGDELGGKYLNVDEGETIANDEYKDKSYEAGTVYDEHAVPVYWQKTDIPVKETKGVPFYHTYVIKVSWTGVDDIKDYDKETDLFYISAFVG